MFNPKVAQIPASRLPAFTTGSRRRGPSLPKALLAPTLVLTLVGAGFARTETPPDKPVVGETEPVALVSGDTCLLVDAKIDTGADRSSLDEALAEDLGLDLDDADTATFSSALGETERPLVEIDVYLAGTAFETEVSVSDRDGLSSDVLIGQDILTAFLIDVENDALTEPFGAGDAPAACEAD